MRTNLILLLAIAASVGVVGCTPQPTEGPVPTDPAPVDALSSQTIGHVERLDPALDALIAPDAVIEILADGFEWAEGPVWVPDSDFVLFSDVPGNRIHRWHADEGDSVWLEPSGYTGAPGHLGEQGSNGLALAGDGRLFICQHGDRRVARLDAPMDRPVPEFVTVADRYEGGRFNSPNDLAFHSNGALYFTDPPYGLAGGADDPERDLDYLGVFRVDPTGEVTLLTRELTRPNGLAFSPDETVLYVANSDPERAIWMAYDVAADGSLSSGRVFFDATAWVEDRPGLPDGLKVDREGNVFATGPGGVLVLSPEGDHLGTIVTTQATANCAFGNDGTMLYMTADRYLLRIRVEP